MTSRKVRKIWGLRDAKWQSFCGLLTLPKEREMIYFWKGKIIAASNCGKSSLKSFLWQLSKANSPSSSSSSKSKGHLREKAAQDQQACDTTWAQQWKTQIYFEEVFFVSPHYQRHLFLSSSWATSQCEGSLWVSLKVWGPLGLLREHRKRLESTDGYWFGSHHIKDTTLIKRNDLCFSNKQIDLS